MELRLSGQPQIAPTPTIPLRNLAIGINVSSPAYRGEPVTFNATLNITDTTGLTFVWQFGDGATTVGRVVQHTYTDIGNYQVRLVVSSATEQREIRKQLNVTDRTDPIVAPEGLTITILNDNETALEAQKPINLLAAVTKGNHLTYEWTFGDGSTATGALVTHSFNEPRNYVVSVTATNLRGAITKLRVLVINDAPPVGLRFTYEPAQVMVGEIVTFVADQDRGTRLNYEWQISDGSPLEHDEIIAHTFDTPGNYEVRVTASNRAGSAEYSKTILVSATPPRDLQIWPIEPHRAG
ncbi:MAG: PKD domain-containing protein, partial [Caldilineaceae bacterium]|nr:PKD domain-containing protein [Caldilineaceae bacterium]